MSFSYLFHLHKTCQHLEYEQVRECLVSFGFLVEKHSQEGEARFSCYLKELDPYGTGHITYLAFENFIGRRNVKEATKRNELIDTFKLLANDKPYIRAARLEEVFPSDIAEECIRRMKPAPTTTNQNSPSTCDDLLDYKNFNFDPIQ